MVWAAALALATYLGAQDAPPAITLAPIGHLQVPIPLSDNSETLSYATSGNWAIRIDMTTGDGCYAALAFDDATIFRVEVLPSTKQVFASIGSNLWHSVASNTSYGIAISMDGKEPWSVAGMGSVSGNFHAIAFTINDPSFLSELASSSFMRIANSKKLIGGYHVEGFSGALAKIYECQAAVEKEVDPFSGR